MDDDVVKEPCFCFCDLDVAMGTMADRGRRWVTSRLREDDEAATALSACDDTAVVGSGHGHRHNTWELLVNLSDDTFHCMHLVYVWYVSS